MLELNYSNVAVTQSNIESSSMGMNYQKLGDPIIVSKNYTHKLQSNTYYHNYTNTQSITDIDAIEERNWRIQEERFANDFDIFKEKFENFLRFEDIPIEYISPIEREFIRFLKMEKVQTLNLVGQWIIDSYHDSKILINIVKILGNVAEDFLDNQFLTNLLILLNHKDTEIKEYVLRIQEKVMSDVFHSLLVNSLLAPQWIDEYRLELVETFVEENS